MGEYRHTTTGEVKSQGEWRRDYPNTSFPRVWLQETLDGLGLEAVLASPAATTSQYQNSARDGVEQDANGNWVEKHVAQDMFADTSLDAGVAESNRSQRDRLLGETDWTGMSDVTMVSAMTTYRQALRDITSHANWPNLDESDWPTKP